MENFIFVLWICYIILNYVPYMLYALPAVTSNPHFLRPIRNLVRLLALMFLHALLP